MPIDREFGPPLHYLESSAPSAGGKTKILVVDDSRFLVSVIRRELERSLRLEVLGASNYRDAVKLVRQEIDGIFLSLLDLNLPDAGRGDIVDFVLANNIPVIVFTGEVGDDIRETVVAKHVIDYIVKENPYNIDYAVSLIARIYRNQAIGTLVVDDSFTSRTNVATLLRTHCYRVFEATNGFDALEILDMHPEIRLVIADYRMPSMDGFELTARIRQRVTRDRLAIIGISAYGNNVMAARYLKNGANDFITKPFLAEEFYCRVSQNVEIVEQMRALREASNRDFLTGLNNRKYLFEVGRKLFANALRGHLGLTVAMIDIDRFKSVNDEHGHDVGDEILRRVARVLVEGFRESDLVCRYGGEEFCVVATNVDPITLEAAFERVRGRIAETPHPIGFAQPIMTSHSSRGGEVRTPTSQRVYVTVSIGVCTELLDDFESMVKRADERLYKAKRDGRNRLCVRG